MKGSDKRELQPIHRGLRDRHMQFIALGGAIGAGLFLGSGAAIAAAGPATLIAFAVCGSVVFLMARALGELILQGSAARPFVGSLTQHISPAAGFVTGWTYWANWILVGGAELTAAGVFIRFWFPTCPPWLAVAGVFIAVAWVNLRGVGVFGEAEFWLALFKVMAILVLIVSGLAVLLLPHSFAVAGAGFRNLVSYGGFVPKGFNGLLHLLPPTLFAFGGVEVVAITARDARDPLRSIPRAINGVLIRILLFYIGTMVVLMSIAPWTTYSAAESPFVFVFERMGISAAAGVVNLIVLTAVISAASTSLYATGRMLAGLAEEHLAFQFFSTLDERGVPKRAILASSMCLMVVVGLNWAIPARAFVILIGTTGYFLLWVWTVVMIAHRNMRLRSENPPVGFLLPAYPWSTWATLAAIGSAAGLSIANMRNLPSTIVAALWFGCLAILAAVRRSGAVRAQRGR